MRIPVIALPLVVPGSMFHEGCSSLGGTVTAVAKEGALSWTECVYSPVSGTKPLEVEQKVEWSAGPSLAPASNMANSAAPIGAADPLQGIGDLAVQVPGLVLIKVDDSLSRARSAYESGSNSETTPRIAGTRIRRVVERNGGRGRNRTNDTPISRPAECVDGDFADRGHQALARRERDCGLDSTSACRPEPLQSKLARYRDYSGIPGMATLGNFTRKRSKFRHANPIDHP